MSEGKTSGGRTRGRKRRPARPRRAERARLIVAVAALVFILALASMFLLRNRPEAEAVEAARRAVLAQLQCHYQHGAIFTDTKASRDEHGVWHISGRVTAAHTARGDRRTYEYRCTVRDGLVTLNLGS